ncbi:nucleoside phosphorylase [Nocardioides soli]|uniref:Uridine phosphorylase n=1 Tax=Nocardioides soli TaxID=1036020 RepID=A0A7W4VV10_9ACTN|nr:uridine phosphorylase [Nocardioides soli]
MTAGGPGRQPHLHVAPGDVGGFVFLPGDPARTELIASRFDDARLVASNREFVTWTGCLAGESVSVTSTGIGGPSAAIAMEELAKVGAHTFIRVGTSGAIQPDIATETLGVVQAAIRDEGTTLHYLPVEFPAVAHPDVVAALRWAAERSGLPVRVGVAQSKDSYFGQHERDRMPVAARLAERWEAWTRGGAICSEMEAAALFIVASVLGVRAGAIVTIHPLHDGRPEVAPLEPPLDVLIDTAVSAMTELIGR